MKIYIAGPLFCRAELRANEEIDAILRSLGHETYLPQRDGGQFARMPDTVNGITKEQLLFRSDIQALNWCDTLLILLDGRVPDEGACFELGYSYASGKRCVAYKTDSRSFIYGLDNLMIRESVEQYLHSEEELRDYFSE